VFCAINSNAYLFLIVRLRTHLAGGTIETDGLGAGHALVAEGAAPAVLGAAFRVVQHPHLQLLQVISCGCGCILNFNS